MRAAFVIPTWNRADFVCEAVESVLAQTIPVDVVVVDDGSTDDTLDRLSRFGDRIRVHAQENAERGVARNRGAALVPDASFLFFLDADDWVEPEHAATLLALADAHPDASLLAARGWETGPDLAPLSAIGGSRRAITLRDFLLGSEPLAPSLVAFPRATFEAAGGFPEERALAGSEDSLIVARALALGPAVRGDAATVRMRKHDGNSMALAASMHRSMELAHEQLFGEDTPPHLRPPAELARARRGIILLRTAVGYYAAGEMREAQRTLGAAVRASPRILLRPLASWTFLRSMLGPGLTRRLRAWKHGFLRKRTAPIRGERRAIGKESADSTDETRGVP